MNDAQQAGTVQRVSEAMITRLGRYKQRNGLIGNVLVHSPGDRYPWQGIADSGSYKIDVTWNDQGYCTSPEMPSWCDLVARLPEYDAQVEQGVE